MTHCARCGRILRTSDPRKVVDGNIYDTYCGWKMEQQAVRNIKGVSDANTLHQGGGGDTSVCNERNADTPRSPESPA